MKISNKIYGTSFEQLVDIHVFTETFLKHEFK